jgi:ERCC4-type nuclease
MQKKLVEPDKKIPESDKEESTQNEEETDLFLSLLKEHFGDDFSLDSAQEGKKDQELQPYIIVDKREKKSQITKILEDLGAIVIEAVLPAGDYLLSNAVAVERKRGDDFYGSLFSGSNQTNVFEELVRLADSVESPMLILEDFQLMFKRGEDMISSLYGALVSIATRMQIPILPTRNINDTGLVLYRVAKQQQIDTRSHAIARRAPKEMTLRDRQSYFMEGFYNVGPTKAESLLDEFKTPIKFITSLLNTEIIYTKTGKPKGIENGLAGVKGFGWKFVEDNKKLILVEDTSAENEKSEIHQGDDISDESDDDN